MSKQNTLTEDFFHNLSIAAKQEVSIDKLRLQFVKQLRKDKYDTDTIAKTFNLSLTELSDLETNVRI